MPLVSVTFCHLYPDVQTRNVSSTETERAHMTQWREVYNVTVLVSVRSIIEQSLVNVRKRRPC